MGNSHTPRKFRPMTNTTAAMATLNAGSRSSCPQPELAQTDTSEKYKKIFKQTTAYDMFNENAQRRFCPDCWTKEKIFSPMTGSTHGIRFKMIPPMKPSTISRHRSDVCRRLRRLLVNSSGSNFGPMSCLKEVAV